MQFCNLNRHKKKISTDLKVFRKKIPEGVERFSVLEEATSEAHKHKWIESERMGRDLGDGLIAEWHRKFWDIFISECWLDHLLGKVFWVEIDNDDFDLLNIELGKDNEVKEKIIQTIKKNQNFLPLIQWVADNYPNNKRINSVVSKIQENYKRITSQFKIDSEAFINIYIPHRARALIVDSNSEVRSKLIDILEKEGLEVIAAESGEEAVDFSQVKKIDMFIIDLNLPKLHGAELAWYLKRHGINKYIIAISEHLDDWHQEDLFEGGFTHVLPKPLENDKVIKLANEVKEALLGR